jgi:hypothetical protein
MSQSYAGTAIVAPVSSAAEAAEAIKAGAEYVDPGTDEALASELRRHGFPMISGEAVVADGEAVDGTVVNGTVVDVDGRGIGPAAAGAIAAVYAWQGARLIRTRHVTEVRRCLDMTESIVGIRPPAWAVRGLGLPAVRG